MPEIVVALETPSRVSTSPKRPVRARKPSEKVLETQRNLEISSGTAGTASAVARTGHTDGRRQFSEGTRAPGRMAGTRHFTTLTGTRRPVESRVPAIYHARGSASITKQNQSSQSV